MANNSQFIGSGGSVTVDAAGALTGVGTVASPLAVAVDGVSVTIVGDQLTAPGGGGTPTLVGILTADPGSPTNDTMWGVRSGTSPGDSITWKARVAGTTYELAGVTIS